MSWQYVPWTGLFLTFRARLREYRSVIFLIFELKRKSTKIDLADTVPENKKQLIQIIVDVLVSEAIVPGGYLTRLIITGQEYTQIEIAPDGVVMRKQIHHSSTGYLKICCHSCR